MTTATAPGKVILAGEHAVVYGRPAIAAPVWQAVATATITDRPPGSGCLIVARDIGLQVGLADVGDENPLALVIRLVLRRLAAGPNPDWQIELSSGIPIASGLGSGAALSTAMVRALFAHANCLVDPEMVSALVFESERVYHGTPSGIDNTVIAYGRPIWFIRGEAPAPFTPRDTFRLAIADSGIRSPTKETVGDVRASWGSFPERYTTWFDAIGALVYEARSAIEHGHWQRLGQIMDENHVLLGELGVSSAPLDKLVQAARVTGALGAKLSGGGRGGNIIALVTPESQVAVAGALRTAGAARVIVTEIGG